VTDPAAGSDVPSEPPAGITGRLRAEVVDRLRAAGCVFAEEEADLLIGSAATGRDLHRLIERRVAGAPLEQVLGWVEFCGMRLAVADRVFVPRRRSQFLADRAARLAAGLVRRGSRPVVIDLCCGAGALGAVVATRVPGVQLHASEIDPAAVGCARRNLEPLGGRVHAGDLFDPLPRELAGRVDLLLANAPYVPTEEIAFMPAEAREHEAPVALDGGDDGLHVLRRVVAGAPGWLAPGGLLLMECAQHQAPVLVDRVTAAGLSPDVATDDDLGATVVLARRWP
jgi:release factor glutamine methyltransferase